MTPPQIVTSGEGEVKITPDRAAIILGVQSRAATSVAAAADNARRQKAVIDTLKSLGLTGDQITTAGYNVSPEMQYNQVNGTSKVTGYVVSNTVRADLRRLDMVGAVIDAALAKGSNEISSLQFFSSKSDSVRRVALAEAVSHARSDADVLAAAAGGRVGGVLEITNGSPVVRPVFATGGMAMMKTATPTPIEPGEQTIGASVTVRWLFVPR